MDDVNPSPFVSTVVALRDVIAASTLPLDAPGVEQARAERHELLKQLDDYVLPRLASLDAPLLAVIGGSTGAGKSTLVNSILREQVTRSGVLRPTTRASVLIHHPDDAKWFTTARVLPELARVHADADGVHDPSSLRLVASPSVPQGVALLDAPDIDSVVQANRDLARQLLAAADLWVFVTTAMRYADAVPWSMLAQASERGTSLAMVLDRVPAEALEIVRDDLARMLHEQGLGNAPVFAVPESPLDDANMLPQKTIAPLADWLWGLADDAAERQAVIRRTLDGALRSLDARARNVGTSADEQVATLDQLNEQVREAYRRHREVVEEGLGDGSLLRGEVLARWQEFVGTGEWLKQFEAGVGRARDRLTGFFRARTSSTSSVNDLGEAINSGVAALVIAEAQNAAHDAYRRMRGIPAGAQILEGHKDLSQASPGLDERVNRLVREWQDDVLQLVRDEAGGKRNTARFLAFGVNGITVVLMLVMFASTSGITGAEIGIASGSAVVGQRLLEAIFGDQAVRTLAARSHDLLVERVDALNADEQARFTQLLDAVEVHSGAGIDHALNEMKVAR